MAGGQVSQSVGLLHSYYSSALIRCGSIQKKKRSSSCAFACVDRDGCCCHGVREAGKGLKVYGQGSSISLGPYVEAVARSFLSVVALNPIAPVSDSSNSN